ncbi:transcriptional regulatory protein moc3 [Rhypophila sp. PSN 637]
MTSESGAAGPNGSFGATNTALADPAQKPKRARTSKPKVKTGCHNCKLRRIKCDEKRPACSNCIRSKKVCTGYPPPPRSARPFEEIRIAPKPIVAESTPPPPGHKPIRLPPRPRPKAIQKYHSRMTPPTTPLSIALPFNQQESLYFQLFREHTANELSGFFDSAFWARTVLRECHSEDSIRHAVVALGALYKTLEKSTESPPGSPSDHYHDPADNALRHWEMAVKKYSHACNSLVLVNSADSRSHRTRLMASVLLACFDSFIGDHRQAIKQIQNGLGLLDQLRAERRQSFTPKPEEPVEEELVQMFTRLAIQAKSYDMAFHFPHPYVVRLTGQPQQAPSASQETTAHSPGSDGGASSVSSPPSDQSSMPVRFESILEARVAWDKLCERIFKFTETMFNHVQNRVMGILPPSLRQYGVRFKRDIEMWSDAFEPILTSRTGPGVSSQEKAGIAVLKMSQIMAQILFLMTFSDTEMQFDAFTAQFRAIVDLATEVVGDEERRAAAKRCPNPMYCSHLKRNHHHNNHHHDEMFGAEYAARHIKPSFSADMGIVPPLFVVATKCRNPIIRRQAIQLLRSSSRREAMWDSELTARIAMWIAEIEEVDDSANSLSPFNAGRAGSEDVRLPLTPFASPQPTLSRPSTSGSVSSQPVHGSSIDFGTAALGPGGNARWDPTRREQQQQVQQFRVIPEEKRVMVRAVEFDLRERYAVVQLGTRGLPTGTPDLKTRSKKILW